MVNKKLTQSNYYSYRVTWSEEDHEYIGLCAEFPSMSWLADTQEKALPGINQLVAETLLEMQANREDIPQPLSIKSYSGKFSVRIPPELHRELTIHAAESKVSFNRYISAKLASK